MDSFQLYVARVNYQTYLHLGFDKPDAPSPPTGHGWTMQNGKCVPLRYTKEALLRYCMTPNRGMAPREALFVKLL